jgi:N6-L-threonylcarbamoyladenine synthase
LGTTVDDALGEAFDKTAKLLSLGFPGGPLVEKAAHKGKRDRFDLPRPMQRREGCDFSFAGLKTALRQKAETLQPLDQQTISDLCASFEETICDVIRDRIEHAFVMFEQRTGQKGPLVVAGGVASNQSIRMTLEQSALEAGTTLIAPPVKYCSDNAAMIAWAGLERYRREDGSDLSMPARPRWPLDTMADPIVGSGKRGAKV